MNFSARRNRGLYGIYRKPEVVGVITAMGEAIGVPKNMFLVQFSEKVKMKTKAAG